MYVIRSYFSQMLLIVYLEADLSSVTSKMVCKDSVLLKNFEVCLPVVYIHKVIFG